MKSYSLGVGISKGPCEHGTVCRATLIRYKVERNASLAILISILGASAGCTFSYSRGYFISPMNCRHVTNWPLLNAVT